MQITLRATRVEMKSGE